MLWIFSKTSDQQRIRATKKRLQARLLELRLYADEPRVVLRAQKALFAENFRYFGLMLRPALFATLPMVLLLIVLDGFYGKRPMAPGEVALVTVELRNTLGTDLPIELRPPAGIQVETPPARVIADRQVSWRIRPERPTSSTLRILSGGQEVTKRVETGSGLHFLSSRRVGSPLAWLIHPGEALLRDTEIEWIEVDYPSAEVSYFGLHTHWLVWFVVFSMAAAFLLKNRFRVTI